MRLYISLYLLLMLMSFGQFSFAAETSRQVTVLEMMPIAAERPNAPASQNLVRIYVNSASWGATTCRANAADLKATDTHLLSTLLFALASQKSITIAVDDSRRPYDDVCQVVWIWIKS